MNGSFFDLLSRLGALFLCLSALSSACSFAGESPPEWSGSIRSLALSAEEAPANLLPGYRLSSNRFRLEMNWQANDSTSLEAAIDEQLLWSNRTSLFPAESAGSNRHLDLEKNWQHGERGASRLQIDRLNLLWHGDNLDITIGRQALGFGRIIIGSPLDVIAPFAADAIDTDIRIGVDAFHAVFNYGLDGQLGAVAVWGKSPEDHSYLGTWTDNRSGVDMLIIGGLLRGKRFLGAGLAGNLGTIGLKGEIALHEGKKTVSPGGDLHDEFAMAAIELWYRFDGGLSLIAQYLYNGAGADDPSGYQQAALSAPVQEGLTSLLGRHYLILAPSYQLHPLATLQGLLIYNLKDDSLLTRPTLNLDLADNLSLQLFYTLTSGSRPHATQMFLPAEPSSEFGSRGDSFGAFLKWFF